MIKVRVAQSRGHTQLDWLDSFHSFSFGEYYDPQQMGFSHLRVINEDRVGPGKGFDVHGHRDMEIISYVIKGELAHKDSLGNGSIIRPGEIQRMSAGAGIRHSEYNPSKTEKVHFLQIWIMPNQVGLEPGYEQKTISVVQNQWIVLASPDPQNSLITVHQDVSLHLAHLSQSRSLEYEFAPQRCGWVQMIKGEINLNGVVLRKGDGAAIVNEGLAQITCIEDAELLLFDLHEH
jgi:redox-sensitive bicupin YhaK (pirin superfamily)